MAPTPARTPSATPSPTTSTRRPPVRSPFVTTPPRASTMSVDADAVTITPSTSLAGPRSSSLSSSLSALRSTIVTLPRRSSHGARPLPVIVEDDVIYDKAGGARVATLHRPDALNALNLNIVSALALRYRRWQRDARVRAVVVKGAGGKAYCAGGDVKAVVKSVMAGTHGAVDFFRTEIALFSTISRLQSTLPQISLLDGYVMGGGAGLAMHGEFRVATENTVYAMPENAIGLIPNAGSTYYLPRLAGGLGAWLGVTGARLKGADTVRAGLATHYVPSADLPALVAAIAAITAPCGLAAVACVRAILDAAAVPVANLPEGELETTRPLIDAVFGDWRDAEVTVADFARRVAALPSTPWTKATAASLARDCGQSQALTLALFRQGVSTPTVDDVLKLEYRAVLTALRAGSDFVEGVTAKLVEKRAPVWRGGTDAATIAARLAAPAPEDELVFEGVPLARL